MRARSRCVVLLVAALGAVPILLALSSCRAAEGKGERAAKREPSRRRGIRRRLWSFERDEVGRVPRGWQVAETGGRGKLATWKVVEDRSAPGGSKVLAITENPNYGRTFNLIIARGPRHRDLDIKVRVKALKGKEDQGGGPIWRARDANNYYIARWNPLETNFRVYYAKNGRRRQLASADVKVDTSVWHTIEILHKGSRIEARFDGRKRIEATDGTFSEAGRVGLWVKADGQTAFDDLAVGPADGDGDAGKR